MDCMSESKTTEANDAPKPVEEAQQVIIRTRGLKKIYRMGETQTHALRGVDSEIYRG